jgi:hypothetical protein
MLKLRIKVFHHLLKKKGVEVGRGKWGGGVQAAERELACLLFVGKEVLVMVTVAAIVTSERAGAVTVTIAIVASE